MAWRAIRRRGLGRTALGNERWIVEVAVGVERRIGRRLASLPAFVAGRQCRDRRAAGRAVSAAQNGDDIEARTHRVTSSPITANKSGLFQTVRRIRCGRTNWTLLAKAMSSAAPQIEKPKGGFAVLWRFLPMLWPKDDLELRIRVVIALVLVLAGKAIGLVTPYALKWVID